MVSITLQCTIACYCTALSAIQHVTSYIIEILPQKQYLYAIRI